MIEHRFNVFGVLIAVARTRSGWTPYLIGVDGKRRQADFVVPSFIEESALSQYLGDLFHEHSTPQNSRVLKIR